ncbi:hypothetical protein TUMSATVNIG1_53700 [Vibrio nigripulchritudo]|uniref:hypothetical protein n=1 Tax=Vibrio nigripulchritudo TaxID=28173 RepID=UPI00190D21BD|nr:hypothetical protein [Vibrio nigripulchritudo]BCL73394.1 hypothetical protein VNTUMSATTG_53310 [Vibrio nigripulchritudo]BDU34761.1 hypothetical protein TUMSATVNIG1_53700 [Vibrio nigripulchritudo]
MRFLIVINTLITYAVALVVAWHISLGNILSTALTYPSDFAFIGLGTVLALLVSSYTVNDIQQGSWYKSATIYAAYYYGSFGLFADGHIGGWSHSDGFTEKILMSGFYILISMFTVIVPFVLIAFSVLHAYLLSKVVGKYNE